MTKTQTHYQPDGRATHAACGRTRGRVTAATSRVTCLNCRKRPEFVRAQIEAAQRAEAAFKAQTPRTVVPQFGRTNADGVLECACGGTLWRERPRNAWSYHYVCAACGKSVHPLTETGMCQ